MQAVGSWVAVKYFHKVTQVIKHLRIVDNIMFLIYRFGEMFSDNDMIVASVSDPHFKTSWMTEPAKIQAVQQLLEQLCAREHQEEPISRAS